ncbi:hypothetical protein E2562_034347 [Oryza meyeriana var. granulata]|uniref:Uncharacterized protein n=1 Tax=Oryza meyeriana var. granulata TaxID=110450 RepID=A0A6G1BQ51_9ORYZ|nr:hypothetical protein E2562_034347 [Oryza meyeriana var. granulata]
MEARREKPRWVSVCLRHALLDPFQLATADSEEDAAGEGRGGQIRGRRDGLARRNYRRTSSRHHQHYRSIWAVWRFGGPKEDDAQLPEATTSASSSSPPWSLVDRAAIDPCLRGARQPSRGRHRFMPP